MEPFASRVFVDNKIANRFEPHLCVRLEDKIVVYEQLKNENLDVQMAIRLLHFIQQFLHEFWSRFRPVLSPLRLEKLLHL